MLALVVSLRVKPEQRDNFLKAHTQAPHYARWRSAAAEVLAEPAQRSTATVLFPRDYT